MFRQGKRPPRLPQLTQEGLSHAAPDLSLLAEEVGAGEAPCSLAGTNSISSSRRTPMAS